MRVAQVLDAVALERAEVIGVAKLGPELFEDLPVALLALAAEGGLQVAPQILLDPIVVEQGVIDVEQERNVGNNRHRRLADSVSFVVRIASGWRRAASDS